MSHDTTTPQCLSDEIREVLNPQLHSLIDCPLSCLVSEKEFWALLLLFSPRLEALSQINNSLN